MKQPRDLVRIKHWPSQPRNHKWVVIYRQGGKRQVRYFIDRKSAKAFEQEKHIELLNEGRRHGEFSDEERRAVHVAREKGFSLQDAVEHYAAHLEILGGSITVEAAIDELLAIRRAEGSSTVHLENLRLRLRRFAFSHPGVIIASVSTKEIDQWLAALPVGPQTKINYRMVLSNLFNFAEARGYCERNPVAKSARPKVPPGEIGILSVDEATRLLASSDPKILASVAIGLFAGLRRAEIERLDWASIDLERSFIEVKAAKAKTAQRRLVTIEKNLRAWLSPLVCKSGPVCPADKPYRRLFRKAFTAAGINVWPQNGLRHSFASYHLAYHQDASKTALQLGHTESRTLFAHYRELVKPEDAKAFWQIFPDRSRVCATKIITFVGNGGSTRDRKLYR